LNLTLGLRQDLYDRYLSAFDKTMQMCNENDVAHCD